MAKSVAGPPATSTDDAWDDRDGSRLSPGADAIFLSSLSHTLILRTYAASLNKLSSSSPDSTRRTTYRLFLSFSTSLIHFFLRDKKILRRRFTSFLVRCALFVPSVSMMACRTNCAVLAPALPPSRSLLRPQGRQGACMHELFIHASHAHGRSVFLTSSEEGPGVAPCSDTLRGDVHFPTQQSRGLLCKETLRCVRATIGT